MLKRCLLLGLLGALPLAAQEVISGPVLWAGSGPAPEVLPTASRLHPSYPRDARKTDEIGYVMVRESVPPDGKMMPRHIAASQIVFQRAVEEELQDWSMKPARTAGQPVYANVFLSVIFNPRSSAPNKPEATPRLLAVTPIYLPPRLLSGLGAAQIIRVRVALDESGKVTQVDFPTGDHGVDRQVREALGHWQFSPARHLSQPVASTAEFNAVAQAQAATTANIIPAKSIKRVSAFYPMQMRWSRMQGVVRMGFAVNELGVVEDISVIDSNNPGFEDAAMQALRQWRYEPATRDGQPITSHLQVTIHFEFTGPGGSPGNDAFSISSSASLPEQFRYDTAPKIKGMIAPVYPYELLRDGQHGDALVAFIIGPDGRVHGTKVIKASRPEFAASLVAAVSTFRFDPALRKGKPVQTLSSYRQEFSRSMPMPGNVSGEVYEDVDLANSLIKHPDRITPARRLDAPLHPISRRTGVFPPDLAGSSTEGTALIRIIVDEDGHARLPRVLSASAPAFGYAAVQAAQYWRFDPPKSGGKTVTTSAEVPFVFKLSTPGSS